MPSDSGADLTESEIVSLGSDRRRLLVALAATTRLAPFLRCIPDVASTNGIGDVHQRLLASYGTQESIEQLALEFPGPGEVAVPSPEESSEVPACAFLADTFVEALWACLGFIETRNWEEVSLACGRALEAMELWSEYDLDRSWSWEAARADPVGFHVGKYTFEPVMAELGAQRLDLLLAGSDDPDVERLVLERAVRQGEWLEQRFAAWELRQ